MQYILSQSEFDALTPVKGVQERNKALEIACKIILSVSAYPCGETYCDDCPISPIRKQKEKEGLTHDVSKLLCTKNRNYSK